MARKRRKPPTLAEKLASVLIGQLGLPSHEAVKLRAAEVLRQFECHHVLPVGMGGDNRPFNLHMMLKPAHRERTPGDITAVARHTRSIRKRELALVCGGPHACCYDDAGVPCPYCEPRSKPRRLMQYTAMKATHKRDFRTGRAERRAP